MPDGSRNTSYFYPAQKILNDSDFIKKINNFELETIPHPRFKSVEKIIESSTFDINKIKNLSPCLHKLLMWVMGKYIFVNSSGVIEFHRVIRKYSLSSYDYDFLTDDEIFFCTQMDNILVLYYKLLRYANNYCKSYEKNAQNMMLNMNV